MSVQDERAQPQPAPGWLTTLALILVAISPTQFSYAYDKKHGPFIAACDVFAGILFLVWLAVRGRYWKSLRRPPLQVWAWLAVVALSATQAGDLKQAAVKIIQVGLYFVAVYVMYCDLFASRRGVRQAVSVLAGATAVVVLWGLVDYVRQGGPAGDPMLVRASLENRNIYSAYLAMVLPVMLALSFAAKDGIQRAVLLAVVAVGTITMLSGLMVWIVLAVMLGLLIWGGFRPRPAPEIIGLLVLGALVIGVLPRNASENTRECFDPIERGQVFKTGGMPGDIPPGLVILKKRWIEWHPALRMLSEHFMLGVGTGNYQLNIGRYYETLPDAKKSQADTANLYLVTASSEGFASLICLVALLALFWRQSRAMRGLVADAWGRALSAGICGAVISLVIANFFTSLFVRGAGLVWVLLFALTTLVVHDRVLLTRDDTIPEGFASPPKHESEASQ
jgi:hypothetical protein